LQKTNELVEKLFSRKRLALEQYSKHPLAIAIVTDAKKQGVEALIERPGEGLRGTVEGRTIQITGRKKVQTLNLPLPEQAIGLECLIFVNDKYASAFRFHDAPCKDSASFIRHLQPKHGVRKVMLVSGDRESEVTYLAESVGISEVHAGKSPEEKVAIVKNETAKAETLFVCDGINDAPALMAATVGVAFGSQNDITAESAAVVSRNRVAARMLESWNPSAPTRRIRKSTQEAARTLAHA
jgi:P-type E1-E2 ATPase